MIILGLDPGTAACGYGFIKSDNNHCRVLDYGVIQTSPKDSEAKRLLKQTKNLEKLIKKFKPDLVSIEKLFFFKNLKTAIPVAQARGNLLTTCAKFNLKINEFTPLEIKMALTGYGRAQKEQIQNMVKMILDLKELPKPDDASDALACAICLAHSIKS